MTIIRNEPRVWIEWNVPTDCLEIFWQIGTEYCVPDESMPMFHREPGRAPAAKISMALLYPNELRKLGQDLLIIADLREKGAP